MAHPYGRLSRRELAGLGESGNEWGVRVRAWALMGGAAAFPSTVHLGYRDFIKQRKIKSSTARSDTIKRSGKWEVCEV